MENTLVSTSVYDWVGFLLAGCTSAVCLVHLCKYGQQLQQIAENITFPQISAFGQHLLHSFMVVAISRKESKAAILALYIVQCILLENPSTDSRLRTHKINSITFQPSSACLLLLITGGSFPLSPDLTLSPRSALCCCQTKLLVQTGIILQLLSVALAQGGSKVITG